MVRLLPARPRAPPGSRTGGGDHVTVAHDDSDDHPEFDIRELERYLLIHNSNLS